jgi:hypothetical protein
MRKIYRARRDSEKGAHVLIVTDKGSAALPVRLDVTNHSPDGFEWGYGGSGPAQLALAMCIDALGGNTPHNGPCYSSKVDCICGGDCVCGRSGNHNTHECKRCGETWERTEIARARKVYQHFKFKHLGGITENEWTMSAAEVRGLIIEIEREVARRENPAAVRS